MGRHNAWPTTDEVQEVILPRVWGNGLTQNLALMLSCPAAPASPTPKVLDQARMRTIEMLDMGDEAVRQDARDQAFAAWLDESLRGRAYPRTMPLLQRLRTLILRNTAEVELYERLLLYYGLPPFHTAADRAQFHLNAALYDQVCQQYGHDAVAAVSRRIRRVVDQYVQDRKDVP
jgi:hypothetical protein